MHFWQPLQIYGFIFISFEKKVIAFFGQISTQWWQRTHFSIFHNTCISEYWLSGLAHQAQWSGHPLKNTTVRIPGPSFTLNFWMLNIIPFFVLSAFFIFIPPRFSFYIGYFFIIIFKVFSTYLFCLTAWHISVS